VRCGESLPRQRFEAVELVERLAIDSAIASDRPLF
jgi:hypothetical protein